MTPEEIRALDKRNVAIHESGHLTIAVAAGNRARAFIEECEVKDLMHDKSWTGQVQLLNATGGVSPEIAISGVVAEAMFDLPSIDAADFLDVIDLDDKDFLSDSDRRGLPEDRTELLAVVERVVANLNQHRGFWTWAFEQLMESSIVTDGMAHDRFNGISYNK